MPGRKIPLINDQIYHVINRGVASQPIFLNRRNYQRIWETIFYYQNQRPVLSYSHFFRLSKEQKENILSKMKQKAAFKVEIIALCLMPNHYHFLLKQLQNNGISSFMSNIANSYTRYFNVKNKRTGHLFQGKFKAVRIENDSQLLHASRYIHLNPYSSFVVKNIKEIEIYQYSSLPEYLGYSKNALFGKNDIMGMFKNDLAYKKFILDQADYQKNLQQIKHLVLE